MTKPMREIQDQMMLYADLRQAAGPWADPDPALLDYGLEFTHDGTPYLSKPDLSGVEAVAAKYCPATPTWRLPDVSYSAPVVLDPSEAFVRGMQRAYAEHLAREMREYVEGLISAPEPRTMLDLITPRRTGK